MAGPLEHAAKVLECIKTCGEECGREWGRWRAHHGRRERRRSGGALVRMLGGSDGSGGCFRERTRERKLGRRQYVQRGSTLTRRVQKRCPGAGDRGGERSGRGAGFHPENGEREGAVGGDEADR